MFPSIVHHCTEGREVTDCRCVGEWKTCNAMWCTAVLALLPRFRDTNDRSCHALTSSDYNFRKGSFKFQTRSRIEWYQSWPCSKNQFFNLELQNSMHDRQKLILVLTYVVFVKLTKFTPLLVARTRMNLSGLYEFFNSIGDLYIRR